MLSGFSSETSFLLWVITNIALREAAKLEISLDIASNLKKSKPESSSSKMQNRGSMINIWMNSNKRLSPPENETLTFREKRELVTLKSLVNKFTLDEREPLVPARLAMSFKNWKHKTPGISMGFWKAKNTPALAADKWERFGQSKPQQLPRPEIVNSPVTASAEAKVDLPAALRPMRTDNSPGESFKLKSLRIVLDFNSMEPNLSETKD